MLEKQQQEATIINGWLARMTLREKIGQMTMAERMHVTPGDVKQFALGSVLSGGGSHPGENTPADWVKMNDEFWQAAVADEDALGIPILFGIDAVHGHNNVKGATIFPHNISFGAARDVELVSKMAQVTAKEILASGVEWNFAPTLAVAQNCQWGRTYESYGQDSALVGKFGEAYITALQGEGVIGCVKHWVGDGATTHGIDQGETTLSWEELEAVHVSPYYLPLAAGVKTVMVSFNSWNGDKCHGHHFLVTQLLKEKLGFEGIVVSDWDGIDYLNEDFASAVRQSVNAGLDMFMVPERWQLFIETLLNEVELERVPQSRIDDAVTRIVRTKLRYGLFDEPRPRERSKSNNADFGCEAHREVAREVVRKSLVLLKHENDVLPLSTTQKILVAGKSANSMGIQSGGWTVSWQGSVDSDEVVGTTIWEGISAHAPTAVLSEDLTGSEANTADHDVAIVVIGETPYAEGYGDIRHSENLLVQAGSMINGTMNPLEPYATTLQLSQIHPEDLACIERISRAGVPVVAVLVSGRPLVVNAELSGSHAFVAAWLPGSEGAGVANVLFGEYEFEGRLPVAWPADDVPEGQQMYKALLPAGFGLTVGE